MTTIKDLIRDYGTKCYDAGVAWTADEPGGEPTIDSALEDLIEEIKDKFLS